MEQLTLPILVFVTILCLGGAMLTALASRRSVVRRRLEQLTPAEPAVPHRKSSLVAMVRRIGKWMSKGTTSTQLQQDLAKAGFHDPSAASIFLGAKLLLLLLSIIALTAMVVQLSLPLTYSVAIVAIGGCLLFFLPNLVVTFCRKKRKELIEGSLPDAVDLLEICVSSGMGVDAAWNLVADDVRTVCPVLADEMALTSLEIHLGAPRLTAMRHMAQRVDAEDIESLVIVLVQSERFGTSVADALRTFTNSARELRSMRAQEKAERMAVRLLFPMVLFIFPAVFMVLVGPAVITLAKMWL